MRPLSPHCRESPSAFSTRSLSLQYSNQPTKQSVKHQSLRRSCEKPPANRLSGLVRSDPQLFGRMAVNVGTVLGTVLGTVPLGLRWSCRRGQRVCRAGLPHPVWCLPLPPVANLNLSYPLLPFDTLSLSRCSPNSPLSTAPSSTLPSPLPPQQARRRKDPQLIWHHRARDADNSGLRTVAQGTCSVQRRVLIVHMACVALTP